MWQQARQTRYAVLTCISKSIFIYRQDYPTPDDPDRAILRFQVVNGAERLREQLAAHIMAGLISRSRYVKKTTQNTLLGLPDVYTSYVGVRSTVVAVTAALNMEPFQTMLTIIPKEYPEDKSVGHNLGANVQSDLTSTPNLFALTYS